MFGRKAVNLFALIYAPAFLLFAIWEIWAGFSPTNWAVTLILGAFCFLISPWSKWEKSKAKMAKFIECACLVLLAIGIIASLFHITDWLIAVYGFKLIALAAIAAFQI